MYSTIGLSGSENSMCTYDYNSAMTALYRNTFCNQTGYTAATAFNATWGANTWAHIAYVFRTTTNVTTMYWCAGTVIQRFKHCSRLLTFDSSCVRTQERETRAGPPDA